MLCAVNVQAADRANEATPQESLARVSAAELPAKAASLVQATKARNRGFVTADVVKAAVAADPATAPAVVGAIARALPDMASIAAGTAAEQQPAQAAELTKAAAAAAPTRVGKIVVSVCRVAPKDYRAIALAASTAVPGSNKEILKAVAWLFPELKQGIEAALLGSGDTQPSVAAVLDQVQPALTAASAGAPGMASGTVGVRGPTVQPPYVSYSGSGGSITPGNSGRVPHGQRNYAQP